MKILLVNQCFHPDVVSAGQHLTDLAVELSQRGHQVTVISGRRGYDDPSLKFAAREIWSGICIYRVPVLAVGKSSKLRRALNFFSFYLSCFARMLLLPRQDLVVMMTSPPLIAYAGALLTRFKGGRLAVWVMDLNPDEAVAAGVLAAGSPLTGFLERVLRSTLQRAQRVVVMDRFMRQRLLDKGVAAEKIVIVPPWSHDAGCAYDESGRHAFRRQHQLQDKFVVMYSGNHSPCHPLDTLLAAARKLSQHQHIRFCFIGGGSEFRRVKAFAEASGLANVIWLPYQPLAKISASLSAADLHVIVMGDAYTGIKHPCKIYNIIALGIPFVFIGPGESHVSDLISSCELQAAGKTFLHGEVDPVAEHIERAAAAATHFDHSHAARQFAQSVLVARLADALQVPGSRLAPVTKRAEAAWGN